MAPTLAKNLRLQMGGVMLRRVAGILPLLISAIFSAAHAADMPLGAPSGPGSSWSGFYLGVNAGESWGNVTDTINFVPAGFVALPIATDKTHPDGVIGGAQAGFNWQTGPAVFGLETDIQGSSQSDTATITGNITTCGVPCSVTETDKVTWFGTTRARLGYAWPNWMVYLTGGFAYGGIGTSGTEIAVGGVVPSINLTNTTNTRAGWTAGGGIEGRLTNAWSWKVEYLHLDFGTVNYSLAEFPPLYPGNITQSLRVTSEVVRAGLNYHFNFGGL